MRSQSQNAPSGGGLSFPLLVYDAPLSLTTVPSHLITRSNCAMGGRGGDDCSICLEKLSSRASVMIRHCEHYFHGDCLESCFERSQQCPNCRSPLLQGPSPSGSLEVESISNQCPRFHPQTGCIQLTYDIPSGIQRPYQEHPDHQFHGTIRVAYLPDNTEGRALLIRFQYTWMCGLGFRIGTSMTSGKRNQVCWNTAYMHKTSLSGGPFGFPDPNFIATSNQSLSDIGIPDSATCETLLQEIVHPTPSAPPASMLGGVSAPPNASSSSFLTSGNPPFAHASPPAAAPPAPPSINGSTTIWTPPSLTVVEVINYNAPQSLCQADALLTPSVVDTLPCAVMDDEDCPICCEELHKESAIRIKNCSHSFHLSCIKQCFKTSSNCPVCRVQVGGNPQGKMPSGEMTIVPSHLNRNSRRRNQMCPGFGPNDRAIEITYHIPSGRQLSYHMNPGVPFSGTTRMAYLPHNAEGLRLLARLKYAWTHGLTFTVGTSLTTGTPNVVVWTSIHHKTSLSGGTHGYPDPNYIPNCNKELDNLGVPNAETCFSKP